MVFFENLADAFAAGAAPLGAYADAFTAVLPWQVGAYVIAALLMLALPARTRDEDMAG